MSASLKLGLIIGASLGGSFSSAINTSQDKLTQLGKEFNKLNTEQRRLQRYSKLTDDRKDTLSAVKQQKQEVDLLKLKKHLLQGEIRLGKIKGVEGAKALKSVNSEIKKGEAELVKVEAKYQRLLDKTRDYRESMRKAGTPLVDHKNRLSQIGQAIDKNTQKAERYQRIVAKKNQLGEAYKSAATSVGMTVAGGVALNSMNKSFADYEVGMQRIGATADMTRDQIGAMSKELLGVSNQKGVAHQQLQDTLGVMVAGGIDPREAMKATGIAGDLIKAYDMQAEDIGQASVALVDNLGYATDKLGRAWDIMGQAGKDGQFEAKDMAKYAAGLGASFQALGVQGDEGTATMAAMLQIARKGAKDASEAAGNMDNFLAKMVSAKTEKNSKEFGFSMRELVEKARREGKNPIEEAVKKISEVTHGDQAKIADMFDDMQVQKFLRPMIQNWEKYEEIKKRALGAHGVVDKDAADIDKTTDAKLKKLGQSWEVFKVQMGETLKPLFDFVVDGLTKVVDIGTRVAKNGVGSKLLLGAAAAASMFGVAMSGLQIARVLQLGMSIVGIKTELLTLEKVVQSSFLTKGLKIGAQLGKGLGAAGGAYGLYDIWRDQKDAGEKKQSKLRTVASYAQGAVSGAAIGMMFGPVGAAIGAVLGLAYTFAVRNMSKIKSYLSNTWRTIKSEPARALGAITRAIINFQPLGLFYRAFAGVLNYFGFDLPTTLTSLGKSMIKGLIGGISDMFPPLGAKLRELGEMIPESVKKFLGINSPSRVFMGIGKSVVKGLNLGVSRNQDSVRHAMGRLARVVSSDFAPKAFVHDLKLPMPSHQQSSERAGSVRGQGVSIENHFNIYQQPGEDADALARRVVELIERKAGIRQRSALADLA